MITKTERAELRSLVRQQIRTLQAEVVQRRAELEVELRTQIEEALADSTKRADDLDFLLDQVVDEANRKANDICRQHITSWPTTGDKVLVSIKHVDRDNIDRERHRLYALGRSKIYEQVTMAEVALKRQETDLLTRLALGGLESEEARVFLGEIPTVGQLVPAVRLAELEASIQDGGQ